ncbi:hypothetical protein LPJ70_006962, partial [Coemansia sp. RSA 2708]
RAPHGQQAPVAAGAAQQETPKERERGPGVYHRRRARLRHRHGCCRRQQRRGREARRDCSQGGKDRQGNKGRRVLPAQLPV